MRFFLFATAVSRPALAPTPIQWVLEALTPWKSGRGVKLTTHFHVVPRLRIRAAITLLPQYVFMAWCLVKHRDNFTFTLSVHSQIKFRDFPKGRIIVYKFSFGSFFDI